MLNSTSIKHPTMQAKLFAAMQQCRVNTLKGKTFYSDRYYVTNKNGDPCMRVTYNRGASKPFEFYAGNKNLTSTVLTSLKAA